MKYLVILLIIITFTGILSMSNNASAITLGMSSERMLETQETILLGKVASVDEDWTENEYTIEVTKYLKKPQGFERDRIQAVGCGKHTLGGCITFDKGQNVLFVLNEKNHSLRISGLSFVSPNPNCTTEDLFELNDANYGLKTIQNNQTKKFFTGEPINITFYAYNKNLDDSNYSVTVEFFKARNQTIFSKTFAGQFEECVPNVKHETPFTPTEMGKYGKRFTTSYGGGELSWGFSIIEKGSSPLEQFNSHVKSNDVWCRKGLTLVQKYDGLPACVKPETKQKLIERGWAKVNSVTDSTTTETDRDEDLPYNKDIVTTGKPIVENKLVPVKITGKTAFQVCGLMKIPCPTNPTFEALHSPKTETAVFDSNVGMHIYNFTLGRTKICYTLDGLNDRYCEPLDVSLIPKGAGNTHTLLSKDVMEWKAMSDEQLNKYDENYGGNFYIELGRMLIKDRILDELDEQNIMVENFGEHILVQVSTINQSLPPYVYYYADVTSTDGKSYRFNGATHSNEIFEFSSELKENEN